MNAPPKDSQVGGIVRLEHSQRAIDFMRSSLVEQRRQGRIRLSMPATVRFPGLSSKAFTCFVRDVSTLGAFFYCKLNPGLGNLAVLELTLYQRGNKVKITCEGSVVRVEEATTGAAIGIAVQFSRLRAFPIAGTYVEQLAA